MGVALTVPTEVSALDFVGNGVAVDFPISFPIGATADLDVTVNAVVQTEGVNYTIVGTLAAPILRMTVAPINLSAIHVERNVPITQDVNLITQGPFSPATHTQMADKRTFVEQQLGRRITKLEATDAAVPGSGLVSGGAGSGIIAVAWGGGPSSPEPKLVVNGLVSSDGTDNTVSRFDHVHGHGQLTDVLAHAVATAGAAGFMSAEMAGKVAAGPTVATVTDTFTLDALPTSISFAPGTPGPDGLVELVEVIVLARGAVGPLSAKAATFKLAATFLIRQALPITQIGTTTVISKHQNNAWDAAIIVTAPTISVRLTGEADGTVNWRVVTLRHIY